MNARCFILFLALAAGSAGAVFAADGRTILKSSGIQGGLVVHLDYGDGTLTAELFGGESFVVCGLEQDPAKIDQARKTIRSKGLYGPVSIASYDGRKLPFVDNLVTLVVAEQTSVPMAEIMRVLHPYGVAWIDGKITVKPKPAEIDEWTHYLHDGDNNAVAHDRLVGPPGHMQFLADPLWTRHHDRLSSFTTAVTAKGRLFYISDNAPVFDPDEPARWFVTARNAFNGAFLWRRPISSWTDFRRKFRSGPVQLQRLLVTDGDHVFVTLGLDEPVSVLDAATGRKMTTLDDTAHAEELVLAGGVLYVQTGEQGAEHALLERTVPRGLDYRSTKKIRAVKTDTGELLWSWPAEGTAAVMPRTLAVSGGDVVFQESGGTVCLNAATGEQRWRAPGFATPAPSKPQKRGRTQQRAMGWTYATLVVQDGVVLSCDGKTLQALDQESGKLLWQCEARTPFGKTPSVDILVVNGVVWTSPDLDTGRDLHTGVVVRQTNLSEELVTAGHHHRCYRNKATDRYVIQGYRGLEFRDTQGDDHRRHNWIRGICQYGILPANGLVYLPPHNCACYPEAKLFGLWALKADESAVSLNELDFGNVLERGPAYGTLAKEADPSEEAGDWPTHRHDARRSAIQPVPVTAREVSWSVPLQGRLTAPVVARDTVLVAAADRHEVIALNASTGRRRWQFSAAGPVDSPPTVYGDAVLFGSADGNVYCLRLDDGELAWRFQAAPQVVRTLCRQQVESLWPVHGSVLVTDDTAYFVAGRSTYIDGGLFLYGMDPLTGEVRYRRRLHIPPATAMRNAAGKQPEKLTQNAVDFKTISAPDHSDAFSMAGNLSDILVADQDAIYLRHQKLSRDLKPLDEWTHHLFSTSSLLDEDESYRAHWFYGNGDFSRLPVAYEWLTRGNYGGFASPLGRLLVYDGSTLWGYGWKSLALYKTDIRNLDERLAKDFPKREATIVHARLAETLPIHARAMIKAGDVLFLGGYPLDKAKPHLYGEPLRDEGLLLQMDASSGKLIRTVALPASPRFDGISAAQGRLYVSLENGSLVCLK